MTIIFDGRRFASEKNVKLKKKVLDLKSRGIYPKLASILVGEDPASKLYITLKKKKAEEIGVEMNAYLLKEREILENISVLINSLNSDATVFGIMVQLPLPKGRDKDRKRIINRITPNKDVDGLRDNSLYLHPTSKAVVQIIKAAKRKVKNLGNKVTIVGSTGMVGKPLAKELKNLGYEVTGCNSRTKRLSQCTKNADILVSCTGKADLIKPDMVKSGAVVVDVGSPKGDVFSGAYKKASFVTPVPGGVGPVTISCLLENLILASARSF